VTVPALVAGVLATTLLAGCTSGADDEAPQAAPSTAPIPFEPCPEQPSGPARGAEVLPGLAFDCLGGGELDLTRAPGVPTVLNLWASWCAPCREELPVVQDFAERAGDRISVIGVVSRDGKMQAGSFADDVGATFPGAFDERGELMDGLGLRGLPYTYLLDAGGGVAYVHTGPIESVEELRGMVAEHLEVQL
jgi:thiol-disulfide isomerase/thioredoxin